MPRRLLVSAETREQASERQPRALRLVAAAVGDQALVDEAGVSELAGAGPNARLLQRRPGAAEQRRRPPPVPGPLGGARGLEGAAARREGVGDRRQLAGRAGAVGDLDRPAEQVGVQRQQHRQAPVADLERQRERVREPPDPLVKLDRAPRLSALRRDPRRLHIGAVRDQVVNDVP